MVRPERLLKRGFSTITENDWETARAAFRAQAEERSAKSYARMQPLKKKIEKKEKAAEEAAVEKAKKGIAKREKRKARIDCKRKARKKRAEERIANPLALTLTARLSMYNTPPSSELQLEEFKSCAIEGQTRMSTHPKQGAWARD